MFLQGGSKMDLSNAKKVKIDCILTDGCSGCGGGGCLLLELELSEGELLGLLSLLLLLLLLGGSGGIGRRHCQHLDLVHIQVVHVEVGQVEVVHD